jgi:hypothetical protein
MLIKFPYGSGFCQSILWLADDGVPALCPMELDIVQDLQPLCFYHWDKEN